LFAAAGKISIGRLLLFALLLRHEFVDPLAESVAVVQSRVVMASLVTTPDRIE
jgi:hypothetical protein